MTGQPATAPGKCGCCKTPYKTGELIVYEQRTWILAEHRKKQ